MLHPGAKDPPRHRCTGGHRQGVEDGAMGGDADLVCPRGEILAVREGVGALGEPGEAAQVRKVVEGETGPELLLGQKAQRDQRLALLAAVGHRHQAPLQGPNVDPALLEEELPERLESKEDFGAAGLAVAKIDARDPPVCLDVKLSGYTYAQGLDQNRSERRGRKVTGIQVAERPGHAANVSLRHRSSPSLVSMPRTLRCRRMWISSTIGARAAAGWPPCAAGIAAGALREAPPAPSRRPDGRPVGNAPPTARWRPGR